MSQWGSSDSGILRKNKADENLDQLLVFGYSCKIFRDDEKALYIDQGKHLIPWMGDEKLKIDRYDGRGTLPDLKQLEASREGYDALRWLGLNESEKKLEELCDSERYYSLEINEEEEEMYKEEVVKRQNTNAFSFNYETAQPPQSEQKEGIPTVPEEEDEPYKPSPVLDVPVDINVPKTVREYARIEKTALFVCRQGLQMEILIKAKQADNPQFSFLIVQDPLYKFYRHVLSAFKNGRYQPQYAKKAEDPKPAASQEDDQDSHYLHPSLLSTSAKPATPPMPQNPPIPSVPYRPSADCSYSQLVNRIQGTGLSSNSQSEGQGVAMSQQQSASTIPNQMEIISQMNLEQQYHQYYYVQQFYEYWRHTVVNSEQGTLYASLPLNFSQLDPNMQSYIHQLAWAQFVQHHIKHAQEAQQSQASSNNNSYAQIVSNLNKDSVNPYTANVPQLPPVEVVKEEPKVIPIKEKTEERVVTLVKYKADEVKKPLLSLAAAYGSGSESDSDSSESELGSQTSAVKPEPQEKVEVYRCPSGEDQTVIDKMAEYVAKNGEQFEDVIKQKGDSRFGFLHEGHEFNKYYRAKLRELRGEPEPKKVKKVEASRPKTKTKKVIAPVSFSIKKPKEEAPKEIKSALPMEDSSEEENYIDNPARSPPNGTTTKNVATNGSSTAQKVPANSKMIYKIGQQVLSNIPQPKVANLAAISEGTVNSGPANDRLSPNKENNETSSMEVHVDSLRRRSKSQSSSPSTNRRSRTPKKRSRSPTKPPVTHKRAKSRSKTPSRKSPSRTKDSSAKNARLPSPIEPKIQAKKKKSPAFDMFAVEEGKDVKVKNVNGVLEPDDPILEMMELEMDRKTAEEKAADAKEKARQLERKRKAAMFLKLKSAENKPSTAEKGEKTSTSKSEKCCIKTVKGSRRSPTSSVGTRRNSEDSVRSIRSRSRTREKSKLKEKPPKEKIRSESKESRISSRRSRSREIRRKDGGKHKKNAERDRSRSKARDDEERRRRKEKRKKSHKRKHSKSKRKSKKHKRSRSPSKSRSRSLSKSSRSSSVKSHISIDSS